MVTALPTLTVSALYVLYNACRSTSSAAAPPDLAEEPLCPEPLEGDESVERRLTILTYSRRR